MDQQHKQQLSDSIAVKVKNVKDHINHPEAMVFLSIIQKDGEEYVASGAVIGCKHGIARALEEASHEKNFADAVLKVAKKIKAKRKVTDPTRMDQDNKPKDGESLSQYLDRMGAKIPEGLEGLVSQLDQLSKQA